MKPVKTFLSESNKIEGVFDNRSLGLAIEAWDFLIEQEQLTQTNILQTHKILMQTHLTTGDGLGALRRQDVWVGGRKGLAPHLLADALAQWVLNANDLVAHGANAHDDFLAGVIKEQHIKFEKIHPFIDGNGRMGRILLNWSRDKLGLPLLVILNAEKRAYYSWFEEPDFSNI